MHHIFRLRFALLSSSLLRQHLLGFLELMTSESHKVIEEMEITARKKSELIIGRAEMAAEKIISSASESLAEIYDDINDDINELIRQRTRFREQLKSELNSHRELLEFFNADKADGSLRCVDL